MAVHKKAVMFSIWATSLLGIYPFCAQAGKLNEGIRAKRGKGDVSLAPESEINRLLLFFGRVTECMCVCQA